MKFNFKKSFTKSVVVSVLALALIFSAMPNTTEAAADIAIASAEITSSTTVLVTFTDPGHNLASVDETKWHIDVGDGGGTPLNPDSAAITAAGTPWTITLTFPDDSFTDTASAYVAAEGLYADAAAVTDTNGDTNVVLGNAASIEITDSQAPTVETVVPANGATSVSRTANIVITFSEPMNTGTWDGSFSTATVPTSSAITYTPVWSVGDTVVTLSHTQNFFGSKVYTGTITTDLEDANGNAIAEYDWSFTSESSGSTSTTSGSSSSTSSTTTPDPEEEEEVTEEEETPANDYAGCGNRTTGFSTTTGKSCVGNTAGTPSSDYAGCGNRNTGFSTATGKSCVGNTVSPLPQGNAYAFGTVLVKSGSKGEACMAWQMFLNAKANAGLAVDGMCGPLTMAKAKAWQASVGLMADGLLGPASRAKAMMQ